MRITRRSFVGSLALPAFARKSKAPPERPAIVLLVADNLPAWALGCYGNKETRTPNLNRLSQMGTLFRNHFVCAPAPGPGRAVILTGRAPMQLGEAQTLPPGEITVEKVLASAGYAIGPAFGAPPSEGVRFLNAQSPGKPFFLAVGFENLRPPYQAPAKDLDLYAATTFETFARDPIASNAAAGKEMLADLVGNWRKYCACLTALDNQIGTLTNAIFNRKLLDTTLVIFTASCGALLGRHGLWDAADASNPPNMFDESVRTPLFWSWPGHVPAQAFRTEMISAYDLLPSICEAAGATPPTRNLCGRSYLALATGKRLPKKHPWPTTLFGHYRGTDMARDQRYKLVVHPNELYDIVLDAAEKSNQYANDQFVSVRNTLYTRLTAWKRQYSG